METIDSQVTPPAENPSECDDNFEREALRILKAIAGSDAEFRDRQLQAIHLLVEEKRRVFVVQRTGWGKSAVYFVATKMLRDRGSGPMLLISPLLALMRNQIEMAERAGISALTINSSNREEHEVILERVRDDRADILLVSPERLNNPDFREEVLGPIAPRVGLLVVDEAHCISDWGHDFRPDYRRVVDLLSLLAPGCPVLCTTATANDRVVSDAESQIGHNVTTIRGPLGREGLALHAFELASQPARLSWLAETIPTLPGAGIVYTLTIRDSEVVASWLRKQGIDAASYSGDTVPDDRLTIENRLLRNDVKVVVATSALGMGFDKPDVAFVIHYQCPASPIAYYQQVGRAGRALDTSLGVLFSGKEDLDIQNYFIETAFASQNDTEQVVGLLNDAHEPMTRNEIMANVNIRPTRLEKLLKLLEVEGAVQKERKGYVRTANPWSYDAERVEAVTALRRAEQRTMAEYLGTEECLMLFLRRELDDPEPDACGICMNCAETRIRPDFDNDLAREAAVFLRNRDFLIEPRLMWPSGIAEVRGRIPEELSPREGRCLSLYNDGGWGHEVRAGKREGRFSDDLIRGSTTAIARWSPDPPPTWVTCIPSLKHPELVPDFTQRLADELGLPFKQLLEKVRETPPQKEMENSQLQLKNMWQAFKVKTPLPEGPVLLVDDMVDSRWTVTTAAYELLSAGSGLVYPFALSNSAGRL